MKKHILNMISIVGTLSLVLAACGNQAATPTVEAASAPASDVIAEGKIRPIQASNLSFQAQGVIEEINVKIGDRVEQGDVLVRLANAGGAEAQVVIAQNAHDLLLRDENGERARLWQAYMDAQVARGKAQKKWEDLNIDNIEDRIEDAGDEIEDRRLDLKKEQDDFDKYRDLSEEDDKRKNAEDDLETAQENLDESIRELESITRERDQVRADYDAALAAEAEAKYQYEITLDGPNTDQLALASAQLDAAQDALDAYLLRAPFDGVVADVAVTVGEQVGPETRAVSIADTAGWIIETTDITELEVVKLAVGQPVAFTADALPAVIMAGTVTEISQASFVQGGDVIYTVRIKADPGLDTRIKWGMTVEITFLKADE